MARAAARSLKRLACLSVLALAACSRPPAVPPGLGQVRATGAARNLVATARGTWLAFLDGCADARAQGLPPGTANCDLRVVPIGGGDAVRVAGAVTTLPGAVALSPQADELAALADYDYAVTSGSLVRWRAGKAPQLLARGVTFHGYGLDGTLGYVAQGELFLAPPGGEPEKVAGVAGAATFELAAPGGALLGLVRRRAAAGGELLAIPAARAGAAAAIPVAGPVGDYGFDRARRFAFTRIARDGAELQLCDARPAARPQAVGKGVRTFAFAPEGEAIAFIGEVAPGKQGNLHLATSRGDAVVARDVGDFRWALRAPRLAWIEAYDARVSSGTLGVGGPGVPRRTLEKNVSDLELSPDGAWVAYLQHTLRGGYSVDLLLSATDAAAGAAPRRVSTATYGFAFSPDGKWLYYRTRCTRSGEACDLERIDPAAPAAKAELVAEGVKSFEFAPGAPGRLLVSWKRVDRELLDVAVWEAGALTKVDTHVLPGSARFVGPEARRVAYAVVHEKRAGVYVADLPAR